MAGRPRTTYKRVHELLARTEALADDLYALMPDQYRQRSNARGPICDAWRASMTAVAGSHSHLTTLAELIAGKIRKVSPDAAPITIDGETMTLAEWSRLYSIQVQIILERVEQGWDWETAVTMPADMLQSIVVQAAAVG
jgi:hypothetical protein